MSAQPTKPRTETELNRNETPSRYWHPGSQAYAPVDVLQDYLNIGWQIENLVHVETFFYAGYRRVEVYYFTLSRDDERLEMPVQGNPVVNRLIDQFGLTIVPTNSQTEENL